MSKDLHGFKPSIAKEFGIDVATFLGSIAYWIHLNSANNVNLKDDRYWTYNTSEALTIIFPYWSTDQIDRLIKKCIKFGLLLQGNYNQVRYDRTRWLALTDAGLELFDMTLPRNRGMEIVQSRKEKREIAEPIPVTNPVTNPVTKKSFCAAKKENSKKHDFAESMDQMASEQKNIELHEIRKKEELNCPRKQSVAVVEEMMMRLPPNIRPKRYRGEAHNVI